MAETLQSLVRDSCISETALNRFRSILQEEDQKALDAILKSLRGCKFAAPVSSQMSPFETVLLLTVVQQHRRVECLEILLQRLAERVAELYLSARLASDSSVALAIENSD